MYTNIATHTHPHSGKINVFALICERTRVQAAEIRHRRTQANAIQY